MNSLRWSVICRSDLNDNAPACWIVLFSGIDKTHA
jgi:hypothetical protein